MDTRLAATQTTVIATGLEVPWDVAWIGTDAYVTERRSGRLQCAGGAPFRFPSGGSRHLDAVRRRAVPAPP